jgi:hypothetical protein
MVGEQQDSIRQGIGVPPESRVGQGAAREKQKRAAEGPPIGGGIGGPSDAETAPEESQINQALREATEGGASGLAVRRRGRHLDGFHDDEAPIATGARTCPGSGTATAAMTPTCQGFQGG